MIKNVGFIGVGTMGAPMAANLLKAGFDVTVFDVNPAASQALVDQGACAVASVAEMAGSVDAIVSSLPGNAELEAVALGDDGVLAGGRDGLIWVDTSTVAPLTSQSVAAALEEKGIYKLEAPVSGGQAGAIAGTLAIMVGGRKDAFDRAMPVLEALGKSITYVGDHGAALTIKLCNNLIIGAIMAAASEAFTMAKKAGLDTGLVHQVLTGATARGWIFDEYIPGKILAGDMQPGFKLSLERKDVGLALDFGKALDVPMYMTALVHQLYTQAYGQGKGDLDFAAICELYSEATGVSLARDS